MANNVHIGNDILQNILARLPGKPLLRSRCVSKHWNRLISDPSFMKWRSRRMILLAYTRPLMVIDDNVPAEDEDHSIVEIPSPLKHEIGTHVMVVGTSNGIMVLALHDTSLRCHLILYNPLTCASNIVAVMERPNYGYPYVFGLAYGKVVRFEVDKISGTCASTRSVVGYTYDVFDLKTSSWSMPPQYIDLKGTFDSRGIIITTPFDFGGEAGTFINGFLYWSAYLEYPGHVILALNVKEMEFTKIYLPTNTNLVGIVLGSVGRCLCVVSNTFDNRDDTIQHTFNVWLMKEELGEWSKTHSFNFGLSVDKTFYRPVSILGDGKIILYRTLTSDLVIYDTLKGSYKELIKGLTTIDSYLESTEWRWGFNRRMFKAGYPLNYSRPIEYVESLVSPSDACWF